MICILHKDTEDKERETQYSYYVSLHLIAFVKIQYGKPEKLKSCLCASLQKKLSAYFPRKDHKIYTGGDDSKEYLPLFIERAETYSN